MHAIIACTSIAITPVIGWLRAILVLPFASPLALSVAVPISELSLAILISVALLVSLGVEIRVSGVMLTPSTLILGTPLVLSLHLATFTSASLVALVEIFLALRVPIVTLTEVLHILTSLASTIARGVASVTTIVSLIDLSVV